MTEMNLLEFRKAYRSLRGQIDKLSIYSPTSMLNNYNDLIEALKNPYIIPYTNYAFEKLDYIKERYKVEMTEERMIPPPDKINRLPYIIVIFERLANPETRYTILFNMVWTTGVKGYENAYIKWFDTVASGIISDLIGDIEFEIESIEERKENQNKELEEISVPTTNYHIHGTTYNSQFGNYNTQNITIDNLFNELVDSDIKFSEDNRELIQNEVKNIEEEVSKHNPSKDKIKGMLERIYVKGETEVIKYLGTKLNHIPAVTSAIMEFL